MKYDYIFSGLGLAAMMTIIKMVEAGILENKNILIVEPDEKNLNDRTWCFWEEGKGKWDTILKHKWQKAFFIKESEKIDCLHGLSYKMIESKSFYEFYKQITDKYNINWVREKVISFYESDDGNVFIKTDQNLYEGTYLFNSAFDFEELKSQKKHPLLQQHFLGWFVKTEQNYFNPQEAVFMDFSIPQNGKTRFMYVLPISENEALIEYTLFSPELLSLDEYELAIKDYFLNLGINSYQIISKEKGNIPMTTYPFWKNNTKHILNIGTAGGWTKASTGFTFKNSDKETDKLISFLKFPNIDFRRFKKPNKFTFYDDLFIDVLYQNNKIGKRIFSMMFTKCSPVLILKFLNEETTLWEDFKVIWSCPKTPFIVSFFRRVIR